MRFIPNRRSVRAIATGLAAGAILAVPERLVAQDTTSVPKTHLVKKGDTLWDLAAKYLSDAFRWPEIYRLNTDIVQDPHWIYPGEILKLPGYIGAELPPAGVAAVNPPTQITPPTLPESLPPRPAEATTFKPTAPVTPPTPAAATAARSPRADTLPSEPVPVVPYGDVIQAPWVERRQGPPVWGRIVGSAELPGIDPARQRSRFQLNDRVLIAPPTGSVAPEHELYLSYRFGPLLEGVGQVLVPTGVLEVLRPPRDGDAAVARIVRMFGEVQERDRLIPFDNTRASSNQPVPVANGMEADIRWIVDEPVLPPLENYLVLTLTAADGIKVGDAFELFRPRLKAPDTGMPGIPEVHIGTAQVVKVTPLGVTAMITSLSQPKVEKGTRVRLIAKMQ